MRSLPRCGGSTGYGLVHAEVRWYACGADPEAGEDGADGDGGYRVHHPLADPGWLIRHVLEYGDAAELLEPPELGDAEREAAERMAGGG